jgi:hypothetical protein
MTLALCHGPAGCAGARAAAAFAEGGRTRECQSRPFAGGTVAVPSPASELCGSPCLQQSPSPRQRARRQVLLAVADSSWRSQSAAQRSRIVSQCGGRVALPSRVGLETRWRCAQNGHARRHAVRRRAKRPGRGLRRVGTDGRRVGRASTQKHARAATVHGARDGRTAEVKLHARPAVARKAGFGTQGKGPV